MTNAQIDRVLAGDPSFGVVPLIFAKAVKGAAGKRAQEEAPPPAPIVVVPPPAPAGPGAGMFALVSLLALGAGVGVGYMVGRR